MNKKQALAKHLNIEVSEIIKQDKDTFKVKDRMYLVVTEKTAKKRAKQDILSSLWAFKAEFIIDHSNLPDEAVNMIHKYQSEQCESANDIIRALIKNINMFIEDAIQSDGIAHFIGSYDDREYEIDKYRIYRTE